MAAPEGQDAPHRPAEHDAKPYVGAEQTDPQAPQLLRSLCVSSQMPLQARPDCAQLSTSLLCWPRYWTITFASAGFPAKQFAGVCTATFKSAPASNFSDIDPVSFPAWPPRIRTSWPEVPSLTRSTVGWQLKSGGVFRFA